MLIKDLKLKNFRNHTNRKFSFDDKLTVILGTNGSGKTNILEAIHVMASGKSQRARYDIDLINYDQTFCSIEANILNQQDQYSLEMQILRNDTVSNLSSKTVKVNKVPKSISAFTGVFNVVLFTPEDISIITGSPAERRKFLDFLLSQTDREYKRNLSSYTKALRQRNRLLEQINEQGYGKNQLDFWNEQVCKFGTDICEKRAQFVDYTNSQLPTVLGKLEKNGSHAKVIYKDSKIDAERLAKYQDKEIAAKSTLIGPHREDFEIEFKGHNVAEFGSRGQQRTILLSLKLIEIDFIEYTKQERPALLLDDIFSELDDLHRQTVFDVIGMQQTIITSAEPESVLGNISGQVINL